METHLAHLKTTMKMDVLHCQTVLGVHKELLVFAILYNLVRLVMLQSARQQQVDVERISFLDALRWLGAPDTGVHVAAEKAPILRVKVPSCQLPDSDT
jgi:hypothetical protein